MVQFAAWGFNQCWNCLFVTIHSPRLKQVPHRVGCSNAEVNQSIHLVNPIAYTGFQIGFYDRIIACRFRCQKLTGYLHFCFAAMKRPLADIVGHGQVKIGHPGKIGITILGQSDEQCTLFIPAVFCWCAIRFFCRLVDDGIQCGKEFKNPSSLNLSIPYASS